MEVVWPNDKKKNEMEPSRRVTMRYHRDGKRRRERRRGKAGHRRGETTI